jgi:hypothetical protein
VFICSHANRAATAARDKTARTLERSAGLGAAALEHRAQLVVFMERHDGPDRTEVDIVIPKAPVAGLRCRLLLDVGAWSLREIDIEDESQETAERAKTAKVEKSNTARGERRTAIMAAVLSGPTDTGVSFTRIFDRVGGRFGDLRAALAVMIEDGLLEPVDGPKPERGGPRPVHYRVRKASVPSRDSSPPTGMNEAFIHSFPPPTGGGREGMNEAPLVPVPSEGTFSTGRNEREGTT